MLFRSRTFFYVEEETRSSESLVLSEFRLRAGSNGKGANQLVERVPNGPSVRVGTEISSPRTFAPTHDGRPRPFVRNRDREEWIALIVAKSYVKSRTVLFDQVVLEHERFELVAYLDPLDAVCRGHHRGGSWMLRRAIDEVGRDARTQVLRLADIDDAAD